MKTRSMANVTNEQNYRDMDEPDYIYIHLTREKRIPSEKQVRNIMNRYGVIDRINYHLSKHGVPRGIYVYFDSLDTKCRSTLDILSNMIYAGNDTIRIKFKNSIRTIYVDYVITSSSSPISYCDTIEPVPLRRSTNCPTMSQYEITEALYKIINDVHVIKDLVENAPNMMA